MTQEQLAEKLGVSVPAVSKWETNVSMPDITLLAPIARVFNISIDKLLAFNSELTEDEINRILNDIRKRTEENGLAEGMKYADEMLHQYPNSEKLRLETAYKLSAVAQSCALKAGDPDDINQIYEKKVTKIFEELMYSEDFYIINAAKTGVASCYLSGGRLDEAEIIFEQMKIPEEWNSKRILPTVYVMKKDYEKAFIVSEQNLQTDWQNIVIDLRTIYNIVLIRQDYDRALEIATTVCMISNCLGTWLNNGLDMLLEVYLLKNDIENALSAFTNYIDKLIESITVPDARLGASEFFAEMNERMKSEVASTMNTLSSVNILQIMYLSITNDRKYDIIRNCDIYQRSMMKLEQCMQDSD
jgi:putative transcriptional regulator